MNEPTAKRGLIERIQGKVKEMTGNLVGDDDLAREGRLHQEKADALAQASQLDADADQAEEEAEVVAREQELAVQARELAAEEATVAREERLEREQAEDQLRIEREKESRRTAAQRAADAEAAQVQRDEAAALRRRQERQHEITALKDEAARARAVASAVDPSAPDTTKGTP